MIFVASLLLAVLVAAWIGWPLFVAGPSEVEEPVTGGGELWAREKAVAVLAIKEADFDLATGKLTDEDYGVLRSDYEGRALQAMSALDSPAPAAGKGPALGAARFCPACGSAFAQPDRFCAGCGHARPAA